MILGTQIEETALQVKPRFEEGVQFADGISEYDGQTQITPTKQTVSLPTSQTFLAQDITVAPIPDTFPTVEKQGTAMLLTGDLPQGIERVVTDEGTYVSTEHDTVTSASLLDGVTAHGADGEVLTGAIPRMRVSEVIKNSCSISTAGKYLESNILVDCDTGKARTGTFVPSESTHTMSLSGVTTYRPTGCVVTATGFGSNGDLTCVFDMQGLGVWFDLQQCSITAQIHYTDDGVNIVLPNNIYFKSSMTYRWVLFR